MAKIKIKFGESEIEIDSRDFYVDNETIGDVITKLTTQMQENKERFGYEDPSPTRVEKIPEYQPSNFDSLDVLDDAEVHEPEFSEARSISGKEIKGKLQILATKSFFDTPKTVSETVEQLREFGWAASPLDVSKVLAKMAFNKEILKNSHEQRNYYFLKEAIISN